VKRMKHAMEKSYTLAAIVNENNKKIKLLKRGLTKVSPFLY